MLNVQWFEDCPSCQACKNLHSVLVSVGVPDTDITVSCSQEGEWPCESMLSNAKLLYESVSHSNADEVLSFIEPLFAYKDHMVDRHFASDQIPAPFYCPELQIDIYEPCATNSCTFYTNDPWVKNCILYYRLRHDRDTLNLNELAFLLGRDVATLRSALNRAFRQLGQGALKETITREHASSMVSRVITKNVCVACERPVDLSKRRPVRRGNLVYCSRHCCGFKPPHVIKIEHEFSLPIDKVLELCVNRFSNVKNMCAALSLGPRVFLEWCKRYGVVVPKSKLP